MNNPLYIPCSSLLEDDLTSLISLALSNDRDRVDKHGARKVALKYLLTMKSIQLDLSKWINEEHWRLFEEQYQSLRYVDPYKASFHEKRDQTFEPYWELSMDSKSIHPLAINARRFHLRDRPFNNEKLKIYFNHKQLENIPYSMGSLATTGFLDNDCRENLRKHPIIQRKNTGQIETKLGRIEKIVFELPPEEHVIILDFADERMPGGLFLEGANTQEETICYNSEAYRALLDLKYQRFEGGFFIPEFGCLYLKELKFFHPKYSNCSRQVDIVAGACYDLTGEHGLYKRPRDEHLLEKYTKRKLRTIIAACQANSRNNGEQTTVVLGPIGCGAFKNDLRTIARLWKEVLCQRLDEQSNTEQRHAFYRVLFISGTEQKLNIFREIFQLDDG